MPTRTLDTEAVQIDMVNASHGLATDSSTIPYIADWASTVPGASIAKTVQSTATRVRDAAIKILAGLDTHQIPDGTPPGLDRGALRASSRTAKSQRTPTRSNRPTGQAQVLPSTPPAEELGL